MSEENKIREIIGWYKVAFAIFIATDLSLLAWFAQNFKQQSLLILLLCSIAIIFVTVVVVLINKKAFKCFDRLGEL
ncbi:hypothetical protein SPBRAN_1728 [uncultured Candidatus Thioglobus sp.]|nr:hypothetical protein SPBRAN_1728 [uncultured Candidatus Thioglobus sp.]